MNKKFAWRKLNISALLAMVLVMILCLPVRVDARGLIDTTQPGDMTLQYTSYEAENSDKIIPITGVKVSIYKVADISPNGEFKLWNTYANIGNFPVTDINKINDQKIWKQIASVIGGFIYQNNIWPSASITTDSEGNAHFSGIDMGLYYVGPVVKNTNDCIYSFDPFMISVPGLDENGEWVNPVNALVARVKCKITMLPKDVSYEVLKSWNDAGYESARPSSIVVTLYCDGAEYKTVTLSAANNWRYSWKYMEGHSWTVSEQVTGRYTVSLEQGGNTFRITNTYNPPETPPDTPETPETPGTPDTPSETPGLPSIPEVLGAVRDNLPAVLGARRLPQTGQLWWPLPVLVIVGILLIVRGIKKSREN